MGLEQDYAAQGGVWDQVCQRWEWRDHRGHLHRLDGSAIIYEYDAGHQEWYLHGRRHRINGPACINAAGSEEWWRHGQRHRINGPAVIDPNGSQVWWLHGQPHRQDGPAVIDDDGNQLWYLHGLLHRVDGPAYINAAGHQEWCVQGRNITSEVLPWMATQGITWPFTREQLMEFALKWG